MPVTSEGLGSGHEVVSANAKTALRPEPRTPLSYARFQAMATACVAHRLSRRWEPWEDAAEHASGRPACLSRSPRRDDRHRLRDPEQAGRPERAGPGAIRVPDAQGERHARALPDVPRAVRARYGLRGPDGPRARGAVRVQGASARGGQEPPPRPRRRRSRLRSRRAARDHHAACGRDERAGRVPRGLPQARQRFRSRPARRRLRWAPALQRRVRAPRPPRAERSPGSRSPPRSRLGGAPRPPRFLSPSRWTVTACE